MTIERLFNHIVWPYREPDAVSSRDTFGSVALVPEPVGPEPTVNNARPDQGWGGSLDDFGPGEQQGSIRRWFLHKDLQVEERYILRVMSGTDAGLLLRVLSVMQGSDRYRLRHKEVNVEVWNGVLA